MQLRDKKIRGYKHGFYLYITLAIFFFSGGFVSRFTYAFVLGFIALIIACSIIVLKSIKELEFKLINGGGRWKGP